MSLRNLVRRSIQYVDPMVTIREAAGVMQRYKIGSVFVRDQSKWVGILTETDFVRKAIANNLPFDTTTCFLMSSPLIEIDIEQSVDDANHLLHFNGIRHLAVSEKGEIVGLLSVRDLVGYFLEDPEGPLSGMQDIFEPLTILTHRDLYTVPDTTSAYEVARGMAARKVGSTMITSYGAIVGIVTEADLTRKVVGYNIAPRSLPVGAIMQSPLIDVPLTASLREVSRVMAERQIRHVAVTDAGKIIGLLSVRDLIGMISIRDLPRFFTAPVH